MLKVCVCLSSTSKRTRTDILGNNADKLGVEVVLPQPKLNFPQIFREDIILLKSYSTLLVSQYWDMKIILQQNQIKNEWYFPTSQKDVTEKKFWKWISPENYPKKKNPFSFSREFFSYFPSLGKFFPDSFGCRLLEMGGSRRGMCF